MKNHLINFMITGLFGVIALASCGGNSSSGGSSSSASSVENSSSSSSSSSKDSSSSSSAEDKNAINSGVYWKSPSIANEVYHISSMNMSSNEQSMIASAQGILAQTTSRIYISDNTADSIKWFEDLKAKLGFTVKEYTDAFTLLRDIKVYLPAKKFVTYASPATSGDNYNLSINHAATVSGATGHIMVDSSLVSKAIDAGFVMGEDVTNSSTREIFEAYKGRLNNQLIVHQNPQKAMLRDYSIAAKAICCYFDYITDDPDIRGEISRWAKENAPIIGWTENEVNFVSMNSELSLITLAADWSSSLSFLSGYSPAASLSFPNYKKRGVKAEKGKHYVSIIMSDGDNVQWMERGFYSDSRFYGSSKRGSFPMTWTVSPALSDLGPNILDKIYESGTDSDDFIAGPSGVGYINPSSYKEDSLADYGSKTAGYMANTGLSTVNFIDNFVNPDVLDNFACHSEIKGGAWSVGDYYLEGKGGVYWSNDKPFITVRDTLWRDGNNAHNKYYGYTERVAQRINSYKTDPTDISGYSVVLCHAWSIGVLEYINRFVNQLDSHVEIVGFDEMVDLVSENVPHVNIDQPDDIVPSDLDDSLCAIDSSAFYWKQVKDYPVSSERQFDFKTSSDLGNWSLNQGGLEYDKAVWDPWGTNNTGSIKLDGSDLNDKMDAIPNSYMYNMFELGENDSRLLINCKGGSDADTYFRVHVYYEDETVPEGHKEAFLSDGFGGASEVNEYGYHERSEGSNATLYDFSLSAFKGKKAIISLEQDDDGDGSGEQIFVDYVKIAE